jgi:hypothetical protein
MTGNGHVRFGGGPPQKYCPDEGQQLGGGLPNHAVLPSFSSSSLSARLQPVIREAFSTPPFLWGAAVLEVAGWAALGQTTAQDMKVGAAVTPLHLGGPPPGKWRAPCRVPSCPAGEGAV